MEPKLKLFYCYYSFQPSPCPVSTLFQVLVCEISKDASSASSVLACCAQPECGNFTVDQLLSIGMLRRPIRVQTAQTLNHSRRGDAGRGAGQLGKSDATREPLQIMNEKIFYKFANL